MSEAKRPGPGRPALDDHDPSVAVSFRLPSRQYDELAHRAARDRVSVADAVRRAVNRAARDDE